MTYPFIPATRYTKAERSGRDIRLIVLHTMEYPAGTKGAEWCARYFQSGVKASAHYCVDSDSIVQGVSDQDVAWAAPGANRDGLQIEIAAYASYDQKRWQGAIEQSTIANVARLVQQLAYRHQIPLVQLSNRELAQGKRGIIGHSQATAVYRLSDHGDPGPNFPWTQLLLLASGVPSSPHAILIDGRWGRETAEKLLLALTGQVWTGPIDRTYWRTVQGALHVSAAQSTGVVNPVTANALRAWAGKLELNGKLVLTGDYDPAVQRIQKVVNDVIKDRR